MADQRVDNKSGATAVLPVAFDSAFTWDYERTRNGLSRLYEKAKRSQWNASTDLDWTIEVDTERDLALQAEAFGMPLGFPWRLLADLPNSPLASWDDNKWMEFMVEQRVATLSQFLHGEQGALLCCGRIMESVPWIEGKYYASTQGVDEARHVEVFARYLDEKLDGQYPINANLDSVLQAVLTDSRWDMVYLGMQIIIEGLALAAFGSMRAGTQEPLLAELLRYVLADEARHVAFGILSMQEFYESLSAAEMKLRQEFCLDAIVQMRKRSLTPELWENFGIDPEWVLGILLARENSGRTDALLFSKIVPNAKKLGLLDANDGWLRTRFEEIGIIQYEDGDGGLDADLADVLAVTE